jgi:hypothetical protein
VRQLSLFPKPFSPHGRILGIQKGDQASALSQANCGLKATRLDSTQVWHRNHVTSAWRMRIGDAADAAHRTISERGLT